MITDGLRDVSNQHHLGTTAQNVAKRCGVRRESQDALPSGSQKESAAAQVGGRFKDGIAAVTTAQEVVTRSSSPRAYSSTLNERGRPVCRPRQGGRDKAGNARYASARLDPAFMGMGPVPTARNALERPGCEPADQNLREISEAFAAQAGAVRREKGWALSQVNVNGGAIAMGRRIGASGCRILATMIHETSGATPRRASRPSVPAAG